MTKSFQELLWKYVKVERRRPICKLVAEIGITRQAFDKWLNGLVNHIEPEKVQRCATGLRLNPVEYEEFMHVAGCNGLPSLSKPMELIPVVGKPISHPGQLFGRIEALRRIYDTWKNRPILNIGIIGPRHSGRTSLLNYLKTIATTPSDQLRPDQPKGWPAGWLPKNFRFALVSFKDRRMQVPEYVITTILEQLQLKVPTPCTMNDFTDLLNQSQQPTVILLDDVERGVQSSQLAAAVFFWEQLRFLGGSGGNGQVGLVVTCTHEKLALKSHSSPFFNIFGSLVYLEPFTDCEASELLASLPLPLLEEEMKWMLTQSGGWPAKLQVLCKARQDDRENWQEEGLTLLKTLAVAE